MSIELHELRPPKGARKARKRVGRGDSSGNGSYSGKGMKGQKARTGGGVRPGFEGGQLPLVKSLPSIRGFTNIFRKEYEPINLDRLAIFPADSEVTPEKLVEARIIKKTDARIKVLARGELAVALKISAHKFSKEARQKIEAAGGTVKELS